MDINNINKEIERLLEDKILENERINKTKRTFKKVEKHLEKILKDKLNGKVGEC